MKIRKTWAARLVRVNSRGQVVIPLEVRQQLSIRPGDSLVIVAGEHGALLITARRYAESLRGMGKEIYGRTREEIDGYIFGEREGFEDYLDWLEKQPDIRRSVEQGLADVREGRTVRHEEVLKRLHRGKRR